MTNKQFAEYIVRLLRGNACFDIEEYDETLDEESFEHVDIVTEHGDVLEEVSVKDGEKRFVFTVKEVH